MPGTQTLLAEYANGGSEYAFRELVTAYVDFVYSIALRIVGGDRPLAEDVTQAVFTDLARKAPSLPKEVRLGGWLHRHTCFVARKTLRRERRRIAREKRAVELHSIEDYTEANLSQLALVLDEAINDLPKQDQAAIMLRFFEELDFRSIGEALGSSEDAARMRVSRAVDKMGALLKRRGFVLTAAGISFVLSEKLATAAPPGLATRIIYVEFARVTKTLGVLGVLREACCTRLNVGIVSAAVILALLAWLFSGSHSRAKVMPDPNGKTFTPAEFVGVSGEDSDEQHSTETEVVAINTEPAPIANVVPAPAQVVPAVARTVSVKPVAVNPPRALPAQVSAQPISAPAASVPMDRSGGTGQSAANAQWGQNANASGQAQRRYVPPGLVPPQNSVPKAMTNGASGTLANGSAQLIDPTQPWGQTRAMATVEAAANSPSAAAGQTSVQGARPAPRILPSNRSSNDPRKRDRQPQ
jgi:RNA polymerase sigma factor (sigma-70 family)